MLLVPQHQLPGRFVIERRRGDPCVLGRVRNTVAADAIRPALRERRVAQAARRLSRKLEILPAGGAQSRPCRDSIPAERAAWRIDEIDQRPEGGGHDIAGHRGLCCSPAPM